MLIKKSFEINVFIIRIMSQRFIANIIWRFKALNYMKWNFIF